MKHIIIILSLPLFLLAITDEVKILQQEFFDRVIVLSNYKKLHNHKIEKNCKDFDLECQLELSKNHTKDMKLKANIDYHLSLSYTSPKYLQRMVKKIRDKLDLNNLKQKEFLISIDLEKQLIVLFLYAKDRDKFYKIGADLISGGDMYKEADIKYGEDHYFSTPSGVFKVQSGWRSLGEYKSYHNQLYLPYGTKDRFIFYMGKVDSIRYNTFDKDQKKITNPKEWILIKDSLQFALHAHKSQINFGEPYSHGCIRIRDELNYFLDINSILHKVFLNDDRWYSKKGIEAPRYLRYKNYAGEYIVIFSDI